jgi:tetratricopeptide (TPR) repeat protein
MSRVTVFISYSHDSEAHREQVLGLSERLRADGIVTVLDQYVNGAPQQGWPRWMLDQLDRAQFVLVVCTETYYRRFRGHEVPGKGKGVDWEGALITQEIYDARSNTLKFVPVLLSAGGAEFVPEPLRAFNHYTVISSEAYQGLYDFLLGQSGVEPGALGPIKGKERAKGRPLAFDESPADATSFKADISRIVKYAPAELIGREAETKLLNDAWDQSVRGDKKRPHVLTFVALGGEGKTSLVAKWAAELAHQRWPGCDAVFAWSFYSQGTREQVAASSDLFLKEALTFFGEVAMANSAQGAYDKGRRLAQLVGERRALLILDGVEPLQYAPTSPTPGELKDQGLAALLTGLAGSSHGLCVVTTRYSIPELRAYWQTTAPEVKLLRLSRAAGVHLLQSLGVKGSLLRNTTLSGSSELVNEFEVLVEDVKGHALTLNLLGTYLRDAHGGDIRKRDLVRLSEADDEEQGGHAFRVMDAYVESLSDEGERGKRALALLRLIGFFDRPAAADCLEALWTAPAIEGLTEPLVGLSEVQRNLALKRLEDARLLTVNRDGSNQLLSFDSHPLARDYFAAQLKSKNGKAWQAGHKRIYEYLSASTKEGDQPTLEDLQPLYHAVAHGCQAGSTEEARAKVYRDRILRGAKAYSTFNLGALGSDLGAIGCFFKRPWSELLLGISPISQSWLLNEAAFTLRALGRLTEALEPMRAGLEMRTKQQDWLNAAIIASNLSELESTLGVLTAAMEDAERSVNYADRSADLHCMLATRTTHADALHQSGRRVDAAARFGEAEEMQAELQPEYPLLHSLMGFRYNDLLLAGPEDAAWATSRKAQIARKQELVAACRAVSERAVQTLGWVTRQDWLLDIGLDHLTLGRAALFETLLSSGSTSSHNLATSHLSQAVSGLRRAGHQDELPKALLTRAWLRFLTGERTGHESSQSDLDEAWDIAARGPMPLFMADIHLYRARLFGRENPYPWDSPEHDLREARRLIEKHGYWRRKEELEDAEAALRSGGR